MAKKDRKSLSALTQEIKGEEQATEERGGLTLPEEESHPDKLHADPPFVIDSEEEEPVQSASDQQAEKAPQEPASEPETAAEDESSTKAHNAHEEAYTRSSFVIFDRQIAEMRRLQAEVQLEAGMKVSLTAFVRSCIDAFMKADKQERIAAELATKHAENPDASAEELLTALLIGRMEEEQEQADG